MYYQFVKTTLQPLAIIEKLIENAYHWLCLQRRHHPPNADIWLLRFNWQQIKASLLQQLRTGNCVFSPVKRIYKRDGHIIHLWCSQDALALRVIATLLHDELTLSTTCTHVKGHGGLKDCVVNVQQKLSQHQYVCKTGVKQFYQSIDHTILLNQMYAQINNKHLRRYLYRRYLY